MKVNILKEIRNSRSLAGHLVLHGLTQVMNNKQFNAWADRKYKRGDEIHADIDLFIDGMPVPFMDFVREWDRQMDGIIREEAEGLVSEKFGDISNLLFDLEERIKPEVESRLADWEKQTESQKD